jgi:hypothetical protein
MDPRRNRKESPHPKLRAGRPVRHVTAAGLDGNGRLDRGDARGPPHGGTLRQSRGVFHFRGRIHRSGQLLLPGWWVSRIAVSQGVPTSQRKIS